MNYIRHSLRSKNKKMLSIQNPSRIFGPETFGLVRNNLPARQSIKPKKVKKSANTNKGDIVSQIKGLKDLLDAGAISQDEFDKAKKKLLN